MSDMGDIHSALMAAQQASEALATWQHHWAGRDRVKGYQVEIERGIAAYRRLESQLRDGRKHVEPPADYVLTSCECGVPGAMPPCSYCTSDTGDSE